MYGIKNDHAGFYIAWSIEFSIQLAVNRFVRRIARLYEQGAGSVRIGGYVQRWRIWLRSELKRVNVRLLG